jgi:hypothetical protein
MSDIHTKLAKIAGEIGSINKTERNKEQGFNFRSIEQITEKARPLLAKEGVSTAPRMISLEHSEVTAKSGARGYRAVVVMEYTFTAGSDDSSVTTSMPGEAVDYGDKSTSKAVQMAYKYALTQVLQVGSGDDPDAHSVDVGHYGPEPKPRTRSGPPRRTPTPPQPTEDHVQAPQDDLKIDVAAEVKRLKNWAFKELGGDVDRTKKIWADVLATYDLKPDDLPMPDSVQFIEADLSLEIGKALVEELVQPELVAEDARPFV